MILAPSTGKNVMTYLLTYLSGKSPCAKVLNILRIVFRVYFTVIILCHFYF